MVPRNNDLNVKHAPPSSRTSTTKSEISFPLRINGPWLRRASSNCGLTDQASRCKAREKPSNPISWYYWVGVMDTPSTHVPPCVMSNPHPQLATVKNVTMKISPEHFKLGTIKDEVGSVLTLMLFLRWNGDHQLAGEIEVTTADQGPNSFNISN